MNELSERYLEDFAWGGRSVLSGCASRDNGPSRSLPSSIRSRSTLMGRRRAGRFSAN
jgi:hypothetical protein